MSKIKEEKRVKGKQHKYVNTNVKEFDTDMWGLKLTLMILEDMK